MSRLSIVISLLLAGPFLMAQQYQLSKPLVQIKGSEFFKKKVQIALDFRLEGAELYYTTDGSEPTEDGNLYTSQLTIRKSSLIKVKAFKEGFKPSETVSTELHRLGFDIKSAKVSPHASKSYAGNGPSTLIDQKAGSLNFRDGQWLGFNKGPIEIELDLGKARPINEIVISTLTSAGSWIMPPTAISSTFSLTDQGMVKGDNLSISEHQQTDPSGKAYYHLEGPDEKCRFIKLTISPLETLPDWHPGKGNAAWVFLDEIIVR